MENAPAPADPGPHARFPWAPAVLCAASLAMAGWAWMRYSYAWPVTPESLLAAIPPAQQKEYTSAMGTVTGDIYPGYPDSRRLVFVEGEVIMIDLEGGPFREGKMLAIVGRNGGIVWLNVPRGMPVDVGSRMSTVARVSGGVSEVFKLLPVGEKYYTSGDEVTATVFADTTASRLHPTSVAGLVVAAFGTFVFALYLRRWFKERGGGEGG